MNLLSFIICVGCNLLMHSILIKHNVGIRVVASIGLYLIIIGIVEELKKFPF